MNKILPSLFTLLLLGACRPKISTIHSATNPFRDEHLKSLALSQYYRWFQTFEREQNTTRVDNHLSMLSNNIILKTYTGPLYGKEGMKGFLNHVKDWKNSHHVEEVQITNSATDTLLLEATILYQNILPDKIRNTYKIHYTVKLKPMMNELPLFTHISLMPTATLANGTFEDAYAENRSKSFMYYWLYLMDDSDAWDNRLGELLATNFTVRSDNLVASDDEELRSWLKREKRKKIYSIHIMKAQKTSTNPDGTIQAVVEVEWKGVSRTGRTTVGVFQYTLMLENHLDERFARLKSLEIKQISPLREEATA